MGFGSEEEAAQLHPALVSLPSSLLLPCSSPLPPVLLPCSFPAPPLLLPCSSPAPHTCRRCCCMRPWVREHQGPEQHRVPLHMAATDTPYTRPQVCTSAYKVATGASPPTSHRASAPASGAFEVEVGVGFCGLGAGPGAL